ncbi:acyl-CoA N-acyltransferase [Xylogone sp. PMI_703]|nr:acyl-CoA N-acyltransferase [Xylogone sp. PMI_703]
MDKDFVIRPAREQDVPSIAAIINYYILNTVITFTTEPETESGLRAKFLQLTQENNFPFLVATHHPLSIDDVSSEVIGIIYITPWRPQKAAYQYTGEMTLLVHHEHKYKGVGSALLQALLAAIERTFLKELLAVMAVDEGGRDGGLGLRDFYVRSGFREIGRMERVGRKFDRWIDVIMLQMHVNEDLSIH